MDPRKFPLAHADRISESKKERMTCNENLQLIVSITIYHIGESVLLIIGLQLGQSMPMVPKLEQTLDSWYNRSSLVVARVHAS